jgi:RNA polymerase sigma-70 factor (ECF subfamily)
MNAELDRQLVAEVAGGSAEALGRLYDRHASIVYGLSRRIVQRLEDAEEVVQDVFTQVWRDARRYRPDRASVAGWIVMLARTRAIDRLRSRQARPDEDRGAEPEPGHAIVDLGDDPETMTIAAAEAASLKRCLMTLPGNQRQLIDLAFYKGLTHTEIAEQTGVPLGTVKTRIRAAMETLRQAVQP